MPEYGSCRNKTDKIQCESNLNVYKIFIRDINLIFLDIVMVFLRIFFIIYCGF